MNTDEEIYFNRLVELLAVLKANATDDSLRSMLDDIQTLLRTHALPTEHPLAIN